MHPGTTEGTSGLGGETGLAYRTRRIACAASALLVLSGAAVFLGSGLGVPEGAATGFPMLPGMALLFTIAGVSLHMLLVGQGGAPWRRRVGRLCAGLVSAVGAISFLGGGLGPLRTRYACPAALGFVLIGAALLLLDRRTRRGRRPAEPLALLVSGISVLILLGYMYRVPGFYTFLVPRPGMALYSGLGFLIASVGTLAARPGTGLMATLTSGKLGGSVARRFLLGSLSVPFAGVLIALAAHAGLIPHDATSVLLALIGTVAVLILTFSIGRFLDGLDEERSRMTAMQAHLANIVESSEEAIISVALDGTVLSWNSAAEGIYGYPASEVVGSRELQALITPPERSGESDGLTRRVLEGERVQAFETVRIRKDGTRVPVSVSISPLRDDGEVVGLSVIARDITEVKRAQERSRQSEERYRQLFEHASDGIITVQERSIVDVNSRMCRMVGYSREELVGMPAVELVHPDDLHRLGNLRGLMLQGGVEVATWTLRRKDGSGVPVEISAKVLPDGRWQGLFRDVSERKVSEERLRLSEERFAGIISIAADAIISVDEEQRITIFNEGAERVFGYRLEEVLGQPLDILLPERFREIHRAHVRGFASAEPKARRVGERQEVLGRRKNGEEFPAEASISRLGVSGRRIFTVVLRDISERKRVEEALRQSEERFRLTLQHGRVIVFHQDPELRITWIHNPEPGFTVEGVVGRSDADMLSPEDAVRVTALKRRVLETERGEEGEVSMEHGGRRHVYQFSVDPLRGPDGRVIGVTCVAVDITARKRVEAGLQFLAEAGATLAASLDSRETMTSMARLFAHSFTDLCFVETLEDSCPPTRLAVEAANPEDAELTGALRDFPLDRSRPYLGHVVLETGQSFLLPEVPSGYLERIAQGPEHLALLRRMGARSILSVPLVARGRLLGAITCVSTRSGRRYDEADLRLAEDVARRGALAVDNARLYQEARNATWARDEVLGVVAHDLRNPLNAIVLAAHRLLRRPPEGSDEGRTRQPADTILAAARMMNRLIKDMLDVARIEARQLSLERAPQEAAPLAAEAVDAVRPLDPNLAFEVDAPVGLPLVDVDRDRVLQVLSNLLGNAIKFTRPGGRVTVSVRSLGRALLVAVRDTGIGVSPEHLEHVFDRFWRVDERDRRGAGLGLAICKGIIEAHGGRIWAESTPGVGSTFYFTLPVMDAAAAHAAGHPA